MGQYILGLSSGVRAFRQRMRHIGHLIMKKQLETIRTSVIRSTTMVTNMSSFLIPLCHLVVILLFWRYFGDFGSIAILMISRVFFLSKKIYFANKNTPKRLQGPPYNCQND